MHDIDPSDLLASVIDAHIRENVGTSIPGIVVGVSKYNERQCVDVVIAISRLYTNGDVLSNRENIIYNVPVILPGGGGGLLSFPMKIGDRVWLDFSMRNLENWLLSDGSDEVIPSDSRAHHFTDAVATPCIETFLSNLHPSATDVELKFKNAFITLKPDGVIQINNSGGRVTVKADGDIEIDPSSTLTILGNVEIQGTLHTTQNISCDTTITGTADVVGGGKSLKNHTNGGFLVD